jgi:hypothetical protein
MLYKYFFLMLPQQKQISSVAYTIHRSIAKHQSNSTRPLTVNVYTIDFTWSLPGFPAVCSSRTGTDALRKKED